MSNNQSFTFAIAHNGILIENATIEATSEKSARAKIQKELKANGANLSEFSIDLCLPEAAQKPETESSENALKIILSPANSPAMPGEAKRIYPPSIKHGELGTFWGCDQAKLLDTIRLNLHALDSYAMRQTGTRSNFYLGTTLIWTTTKPIATLAHEMALSLIAELKAA